MLTTEQIRNRTKTVTRRMGWRFLKAGDLLCAIVKGQGLKKGEKVERLGTIEVVSVRQEKLNVVSKAECWKEGFPEMSPDEFQMMFCKSHRGCTRKTVVTRIEFKYVENPS